MKLNKIDPNGSKKLNKEETKAENIKLASKIIELQKIFRAEQKHSLLIILQGMDASGKDGAVRSVFSGVNPEGVNVKSWKKPTEEEFAHDFLWRIHKHTPAKGMIQVFNRSHYEDILVPSVNGYIGKKKIERRYDYINTFEKMLEDNGTKVLKFYLHISKDEQRERLQERLEIPRKFFKHGDGDWKVREQWDSYMSIYENIFDKCNDIPWHIVPSNKNWVKVNHIAKVVYNTMRELNPQWPALETELFAK